jgi:hypothetical protein
VNVNRVELDETLDEAGFRHAATSVGPRLGARRIGASIYAHGEGAGRARASETTGMTS